MAALPKDTQGVAGSLVMLTRTIGVISGASLSFVLFANFYGAEPVNVSLDDTFVYAFRITFWSAASVAAIAWLVLLLSNRASR